MAAPLVADASELFTDTAASILAPYHLQGATAALAALSTTFNPSLVYDLYGTPGGYGAYDALWQSADFVGHAEEVCNKDKGPETMPEPARERPDEDQVVPSISLAQDEPQSVPSGAPPPTETTLGSLDSVNADPSSIVFVTASTAGPKRQRKRKAATGATGGPSKKKNTASPTPGSSSSAAELSGCPSAMQYEFVMDGASQEAKVSNSSKPMTQ
ncbi:hypothetical protein SCUCBS95973_005746 [Sporothrix curviconia]|uniref:Uncharacterized protein n=1 Tax=Sporothrix curviconia TaxID=1260050 RepID=A0ABP0C0B7_9PEZI